MPIDRSTFKVIRPIKAPISGALGRRAHLDLDLVHINPGKAAVVMWLLMFSRGVVSDST